METSKNSPKKALQGCGACALVFTLFIIGVSAIGGEPESKPAVSEVTENMAVIFDLEALYGKNIDEVRTVLGEPIEGDRAEPTAEQTGKAFDEWSNTFVKEGYELLVTYDVSSRSVIDFFLSTDDPSGLTKDTETLETILNIQSSSKYTVEPVKAMIDPSSYTGIIATPKK